MKHRPLPRRHYIIWAEAGNVVGLGHLSRARALTLALLRTGASVHLLVEDPDDLALQMNLGVPKLTVTLLRGESMSEIHRMTRMASHTYVLISDCLGLTEMESSQFRYWGIAALVHMTDAGADRYEADLFVNGDMRPPEGRIASRSFVAGPAFHIVRPEMHRLASAEIQPRCLAHPPQILVSCGGTDPGSVSPMVVGRIVRHLPEASVSVVAGPGMGSETKSRLIALNVTVWSAPLASDLMALLDTSDVLISFPGLIAYEAMHRGCPVIALQWKHLTTYANGLERAGVALACSLGSEPDLVMRMLTEPEETMQRVRRGWHLIDGAGAERVQTLIASLPT